MNEKLDVKLYVTQNTTVKRLLYFELVLVMDEDRVYHVLQYMKLGTDRREKEDQEHDKGGL